MKRKLLEDVSKTNKGFEILKESEEIELPGVLRRIKGPLADYMKETRNDRKYERDLWEKVLNSDMVKEMQETKTFYGEADHPSEQEDRLEVELKQVSHHINEAWINEEEGIVEGIVDILDTPNGRIIDSLLEYGSKIGASSRGAGNVIDKGGEKIVEADSYFFVTWDLVAMPSNKPARLSPVSESKEISDVKKEQAFESMRKQIEESIQSGDKREIKRMKTLLASTNNSKFDDLKEKLDKSLKTDCSGCKSTNIEISNNNNDDQEATIDRLKEDLKDAHKRIAELKVANSEGEGIHNITERINSSLDIEFENFDAKLDALEDNVLEEVDSLKSFLSSLVEGVDSKDIIESIEAITEKRNHTSGKSGMDSESAEKLLEEVRSIRDSYEQAVDYEVFYHRVLDLLELDSADIDTVCDTITDIVDGFIELEEALEKTEKDLEQVKEDLEYKEQTLESYDSLAEDYTQLLCKNKGVDYNAVREQLPENLTNSDLDRIHSIVERDKQRQKRIQKLSMAVDSDKKETIVEGVIPDRKKEKADDESRNRMKSVIKKTRGN